MTSLFAINPRSRSGKDGTDELEDILEILGPVERIVLDQENALDRAIERLGDKLERIILGGGDGTLNQALPAVRKARVPLGVIPLGTANDFARSLELPLDPHLAAEAIVGNHTRLVGLGEANGHLFLNAVGIGLGAELTKAMDEESKARLGVTAYLKSFAEVYRDFVLAAVVSVDGERHATRYMQITIANGIHYGGGMTISREARLDDGKLQVLCLFPQKFLSLLSKGFSLRRGPIQDQEREGMKLYSAKEVRVNTRKPTEVTADGELITTTPLTCRAIPDALTVYVEQAETERNHRETAPLAAMAEALGAGL